MTPRPWYLRKRITFAFGGTVLLMSLALSAISCWAVFVMAHDEIDALALEELQETQAYFTDREPTPTEFRAIADELARLHPENPLAWRILQSADGAVWAESGNPGLLGRAPGVPGKLEEPAELDGETCWISGRLSPAYSAVILVDGRHQMARFWRFLLQASAFVLASTGLATLAGALVGRRVSGLLDRVAGSVRTSASASLSAEEPPDAWQARNAPEEIRAVVTAMQDTLRRIREEGEHAQLLTSGMAHELRSPLQNLMGETQVTLLRERDPGEYRRVLESQLEELSELSRAVDNLVTLCAEGESRRRKSQERFDLAEETRMRLTREFQLAERRGVQLELDLHGPLLIDGDRESLLLALRNVVTNAIEWTPRGGTVSIRACAEEQGFEIVVDDTGPGVPAERRPRLFDPFQRGGIAPGRRVGFGIGLALTRSAIEAHGGTIEVGDAPLGGARFRILLPLRRDAFGSYAVS